MKSPIDLEDFLEVLQLIAGIISVLALGMAFVLAIDQIPSVEACCDEDGYPYVGKSTILSILSLILFPITILWGAISFFFQAKILQGLLLIAAILFYPIVSIFKLYVTDDNR